MKFINTFRLPLIIVISFWAVELVEFFQEGDFHKYGVFPRSIHGMIGIFLSPFLHGGFSHLLSNSSSFFILCGSIIYFYPKVSLKVLFQTYIFTGLGVWLFARSSYHIGASGLVYAYASFLFCSGLFRKDAKSLVLTLAVALLYNGMLYGLVPNQPGISWESHLMGAIVGAIYAYIYRKVDNDLLSTDVEDNFLDSNEGYRNIEGDNYKYVFKPKSSSQKL